jgi:hypothetical protein
MHGGYCTKEHQAAALHKSSSAGLSTVPTEIDTESDDGGSDLEVKKEQSTPVVTPRHSASRTTSSQRCALMFVLQISLTFVTKPWIKLPVYVRF